MSRLRECPFCANKSATMLNKHLHKFQAWCPECGSCGPESDNIDQALKVWNRRAGNMEIETLCRENERLRKQIEDLGNIASAALR